MTNDTQTPEAVEDATAGSPIGDALEGALEDAIARVEAGEVAEASRRELVDPADGDSIETGTNPAQEAIDEFLEKHAPTSTLDEELDALIASEASPTIEITDIDETTREAVGVRLTLEIAGDRRSILAAGVVNQFTIPDAAPKQEGVARADLSVKVIPTQEIIGILAEALRGNIEALRASENGPVQEWADEYFARLQSWIFGAPVEEQTDAGSGE